MLIGGTSAQGEEGTMLAYGPPRGEELEPAFGAGGMANESPRYFQVFPETPTLEGDSSGDVEYWNPLFGYEPMTVIGGSNDKHFGGVLFAAAGAPEDATDEVEAHALAARPDGARRGDLQDRNRKPCRRRMNNPPWGNYARH